jgi:hypothetical protein
MCFILLNIRVPGNREVIITHMRYKLKALESIMQSAIRQTCEYMYVLFIILECNSIYRNVADRTDIVYYIETTALWFGLGLLIILLWQKKERWKYMFRASIPVCGIMLFEILFLFFNVIRTIAIANYMLVFLMFLPLMLILFKIYMGMNDPYRLFYVLSDIIFVLAALSLVIWIMAVILGKLQPIGEVTVAWGGERHTNNYFNLCFYWQPENIPFIRIRILRNTGIFTEAPMYNIFLNTALATELFLKERTKWGRSLLFTVTIFTTIGTLGILLMALIWIMKLFVNIRDRRFKIIFYVLAILAVIMAAALISQKWKVSQGSFATHIDDYAASIKAWREHPVIGCGYENELFIQGFMSEWRISNTGLSNSAGVVLAEGGLILFIFYTVPFVFMILSAIKSKIPHIAIWSMAEYGLFILIIFHYRFFMVMLLAFGYAFLDIRDTDTGKLKVSIWKRENTAANLSVSMGMKDKFIYVFTAVSGICIIILSFSDKMFSSLVNVMKKYRLGLEDSQWRGIILAGVLIMCFSLAGNTIKRIKNNK